MVFRQEEKALGIINMAIKGVCFEDFWHQK